MNIKRNTRLCFVFFHPLADVHLSKDPGKIPEVIARRLGWTTQIVHFNEVTLELQRGEIPHVNVLKLSARKLWKLDLSMLSFLTRRSRAIDILLLYHFDFNTWVYGSLYKLLNPAGFLWNKLDLHEEFIEHTESLWSKKTKFCSSTSRLLSRAFLSGVDLISTENSGAYRLIRENAPELSGRLALLPNGLDSCSMPKPSYSGPRERLILNVARIGTRQKATDVLLTAFADSELWPEWKLVLVGPLDPAFQPWLEKYRNDHPMAWQSVQLVGSVSSKREMADWYAKAQVFCLPSRYESFGLALLEAGYYGCACVATDFSSARDMLDNGKCGALCAKDSVAELAESLKRVCGDKTARQRYSVQFQQRVREQFTWDRVIRDWYRLYLTRVEYK